jgi:hypothetical protein
MRDLLLELLRDALVLAGAGFVSYGVFQIHRPAGFIVLGAFMFASGAAGALRGKPKEPTE